jgi:hypothetical protein
MPVDVIDDFADGVLFDDGIVSASYRMTSLNQCLGKSDEGDSEVDFNLLF